MHSRFLTYSMFRRVRAFVASVTALSMLLTSTPAYATTLYFIGGTSTAFETAGNWALTADPAGTAASAAPGASDIAVFTRQSAGRTALITANTPLMGLVLSPTFTGSLLQQHILRVGTGGIRIGSGFYVGGNFPVTVSGSLTMTGGLMRYLQNNLTISGSLSVTRGPGLFTTVFTSTGTVVIGGQGNKNLRVGANVSRTLKNLTLNNIGSTTSINSIIVSASGGLNLSGTLTITRGTLDMLTNSQTLNAARGISVASNALNVFTTNSNVVASGSVTIGALSTLTLTSASAWTFNGAGTQTITMGGKKLFGLTINNTGPSGGNSVVIATNPLNLSGALTLTQGTLDLNTNSLGMVVRGAISIANSALATLTSAGNITASGSISTGAAGTFTMNGSTTLTMNGLAQNLDVDNARIYNLTIGSGTTLTSGVRVPNTLQVNTGAALSFGAFVIHATGSKVVNYGQMTKSTGKLVLSGSVILGGSDYAALATISPTATLYIELTAPDKNINGRTIQTGSLVITMTGETETVVLTETSRTSGVFRASLATARKSAAGNNAVLEGVQDITATATFTDSEDGIVNIDDILFDGSQDTGGSTTAATTTTGPGGGGGSGGGSRKATPTTTTPAPVTPPANPAKPLTPAEQRKALAEKRKDAAAKKAAALAKRKAAAAKRGGR